MYRWWRAEVPEFQAEELLYRRYRRDDVSHGVIQDSALKFPKKDENTGQSVNRSKFSKPKDALWSKTERLDGLGVFQFPVSCLPREAICPVTGESFTFWPKHVPLENNYGHSEVWSDRLPRANAGYVVPTKLVRKELRATIQKNSQIVIPAQL
jgi:hypothetical protein